MAHPLRARRALWFCILLAGTVLVFLLNVGLGSVEIPLDELLRVLLGGADPKEIGRASCRERVFITV